MKAMTQYAHLLLAVGCWACAVMVAPLEADSQPANTLTILADSGRTRISRHLYGHFSEHLGRCIYDGVWVGENSSIPNTRGLRNDVVAALRKIKIPNLRWPGGCFADGYHWMDGIGPRSKRPKIVNTSWGGVVEDNSFGTHEFLDLCEQLECEPVICVNVGSGTVREMSEWIQYMTSDAVDPMAELRRANGRKKPWKVKFVCIGNESWGCGGIMSSDFYANELARYSFFAKNQGNNILYKIASGGHDDDYAWTETILKKWRDTDGWLQDFMSGYSLHSYTICNDWTNKGSATQFTEQEWFTTFFKTLRMEELITKHSAVMDKFDREKRIGLIVDEWGNWHDPEPGTNPAFLYQQNTVRDALVAALNFNIFNRHADRVQMANIAQLINVLQSVILTDGNKMILTPTYHAFDLYRAHQDALLLPSELNSEQYSIGGKSVPALSATASRDSGGTIHINIVNVNPRKAIRLQCSIIGRSQPHPSGNVLTSRNMQDHNTFDNPNNVVIRPFSDFSVSGSEITIDVPKQSIVALTIR